MVSRQKRAQVRPETHNAPDLSGFGSDDLDFFTAGERLTDGDHDRLFAAPTSTKRSNHLSWLIAIGAILSGGVFLFSDSFRLMTTIPVIDYQLVFAKGSAIEDVRISQPRSGEKTNHTMLRAEPAMEIGLDNLTEEDLVPPDVAAFIKQQALLPARPLPTAQRPSQSDSNDRRLTRRNSKVSRTAMIPSKPRLSRVGGGPVALLNAAKSAARRGRYTRAITLYKKILVANPRQKKAQFGLGLSLFESGKNEAARTVLRRVVARQPANGRALLILASIYQSSGKRTVARSLYQNYLTKHPAGRYAPEIRRILTRL